MIQLLATDMDGTLLNSQKEFDNEFFEVLQKVLEKEMYFVIASGNSFIIYTINFCLTAMSFTLLVKMVHLLQKVKKSFIHLLWINKMFKQFITS